MNRKASELTTLKTIMELRRIQRQKADLVLGSSTQALTQLQDMRAQEDQAVKAAERSWRGMVARGSVPLHLTQLLSAQIGGGQESLRRLDERIDRADQVRIQADLAWRAASVNEDAAKTRTGAATRELAHERGEQTLNDASDRFIQWRAT